MAHSIKQHMIELQKLQADLIGQKAKNMILVETNISMGIMKNRIFLAGQDMKGAKIGDYSKKPMYYPMSKLGKGSLFTASEKATIPLSDRRKISKAQKGKKTFYAKQGYFQIRELKGRQNAYKDYKFTGSLFASVRIYRSGNSVIIGISDKLNKNKREGNENRDKKKVFGFSDNEYNNFIDRINKGIDLIIKT